MSGLKMVDFFRKIPADLTEATMVGATLSITAGVFMAILFLVELWAFLSTTIETGVMLDTNAETLLRINFNITMLDLQCDYAAVDVVDVLGTNSMNVTKNVEKWQLDETGKRMIFQGRNREQKAIQHDAHHPEIQELHKNGVHAVPLLGANFDMYLSENPYVFVNFFAPWCIWCQRLEPTWEATAEEVERLNENENESIDVDIVKVDCVANRNLCGTQRIQAFPTLRFFKDSQQYGIDYKQDRTVSAMIDFLKQKVELEKTMEDWHPRRKQRMLEIKEHPGCMVSGHVLVNRVPGNFHIEARSLHHNLNAAMTNLSHIVNHLSFGTPLARDLQRKVSKYPQFQSAHPLDGGSFINRDYHQAHHHYSKVVSTHFEVGGMMTKTHEIIGYQMLSQSQVMHYNEMDVPEAKFSYDLSPMAVLVSSKGRRWYDFVTSVCAIIGGTFTVVGLVDAVLYKIIKGGKQL
jgi:thiol-disulfide isomerase/thioredoxin